MSEHLDGKSMDLEQANLEKLAAVFPEVMVEGRLDLEKLLDLLGQYDIKDFEKYKFEWKGKSECLQLAQRRSTATLRPKPNESVNWDTTNNVYIKGDNLEVLKLLQTAYFRKVKMIYIDPPYNTGNDFVYEDDFADPLARYKEVTEQTTKSNPETMGRFHTNWLNMMYPRLRLAANLLRDDGMCFISIDDNEVHNLRKLCDEIFGEENFRNQITVRRGAKSVQAQFDTWDKLGQDVEHILFYTKDSNYRFPKQTKKLDEKRAGSWNNHWRGTDRPTMRYEIFGITPESGQWRWGKERSLTAIDNYKNLLTEINETEETVTPEQIDDYYIKRNSELDLLRLSKTGKPEHYIAPTDSTLLNTSWQDLLVGSSAEILDLFETKVFETAKLTTLIKRMISFCESDALILDFFSGSASTAHAVMKLNAEDGGNRRFIMVQLPEVTDEKSEAYKAGYKNICEIGMERIRRAGAKILSEQDKDQISIDEDEKQHLDVGFKVFELDTSNMHLWDGTPVSKEQQEIIFDRMNDMIENVKPDRTEIEVVYEIMLKMGLPLTYPILPIEINGKKMWSIGEDCMLMICLARNITPDDVTEMCDYAPAKIVMADFCFEDTTAMANANYIMKRHGVPLKLL